MSPSNLYGCWIYGRIYGWVYSQKGFKTNVDANFDIIDLIRGRNSFYRVEYVHGVSWIVHLAENR